MWIFPLPGGARLIITLEGAEAACKTIARRRAPMENLQPFLKDSAQILRRSFAAQFAAGGDPVWKDLAPSTIARKRRAGVPRRTKKGNIPRRLVQGGQFSAENKLIWDGTLRDSYVQSGRRGHVEIYSEFAVAVGSKLPTPDGKWSLAAIHQYGVTINISNRRRPSRKAKSKFISAKGGGVIRIPARPLRVRGEDRLQILARYRSHLSGADAT